MLGKLRERDYFEDPGVSGWIFRKCGGGANTGLTWLRIGTGGRNL